MSRSVRDSLKERGHNVFLDVEDLGSGPFNTALHREIETSTDVVVILTPASLDRCIKKDDWLRMEVAHAIKCKRNLVPIMEEGFVWPSTSLPDDLKPLRDFNGLELSHKYFSASMDKLESLLVGRSQPRRRRRIFIGMAFSVLILLLLVAAYFEFQSPSRKHAPNPGPGMLTKSVQGDRVSRIDEANMLFNTKEYASAFHAYSQVSNTDLNDISLHRSIEECARYGGLRQQFLERYSRLVREQPGNAVLRNYLGNAQLLLDPNDSDDQASTQYREAIRLDGKLTSPLMNLGIIAFRGGRYGEAEDLFSVYLELEPKDAVGWTNLGLLYKKHVAADANNVKAVDNGLAAFHEAIQHDPGLALIYKGMGSIFLAIGNKAEALKAFRLSLALDYEQPQVREKYKTLAGFLGDGADRVILGDPDDMRPRSIRDEPQSIWVALDRARFEQAEKSIRTLLDREPESPLAWQLLAQSLKGQGLHQEAERMGEKAIRLAIGEAMLRKASGK